MVKDRKVKKADRKDITVDYLKDKYFHDPETGKVFRRQHEVGTVAGKGAVLGIKNRNYQLHRIIWALHYGEIPDGLIDHIDGNPFNNKISNLRIATHSQNQMNRKRQSNNQSGFKGVSVQGGNRKFPYRASIMANGKRVGLGTFKTPEEAHEAYCQAAVKMHGSFARLK